MASHTSGLLFAALLLTGVAVHPSEARVITDISSWDVVKPWPFMRFFGSRADMVDVGETAPSPAPVVPDAAPMVSTALPSAMAPAPGPGPAPAPPSPGGCPPAASLCDFFFTGYEGEVPTFSMSKAKPDTAVSPEITASVRGSAVDVIAANSEKADYICGPSPLPPDNQVYVTNAYLQFRTFQTQNPPSMYQGQYVRLNLTSVELVAFNFLNNLNKGDGDNSLFVEERRCVVFKLEL